MNDKKFLVISFHDLIPFSQEICETCLSDLKKHGINMATLLVVPDWHNRAKLDQYSDFCNWLQQLIDEGFEICLHGYSHQTEKVTGGLVSQGIGRVYTAKEGEFYQLDYDQARGRIQDGLELFKSLHIPVNGFIAPAWLLSNQARQAAMDCGLHYTTYLQHVDFLQNHTRVYAPTLVFSVRSLWRRMASLLWVRFWYGMNRNKKILRLAIHPDDFTYPFIRKTILSIIKNALKKRTAVSYAYLAENRTSL